MSRISQAIFQFVVSQMEIYIKICTVDSVNETERTIVCSPVDETAQLTGVNLQAVTENKCLDGCLMEV
jgi:hypothetical protein